MWLTRNDKKSYYDCPFRGTRAAFHFGNTAVALFSIFILVFLFLFDFRLHRTSKNRFPMAQNDYDYALHSMQPQMNGNDDIHANFWDNSLVLAFDKFQLNLFISQCSYLVIFVLTLGISS